MLHVTNGDFAIEKLRRHGDVIAWREVLHEGPVTKRDPRELRAERAAFLGPEAEPLLRAQDERIAVADALTLWFEADLFDALLVWQIAARAGRVEIAWAGGERWVSIQDAAGMEPEPLDGALLVGHWTAFVDGRLDEIPLDPVLRAMDEIVVRLWQQLPWTTDGLTRSERQLLFAVAEGALSREEAFVRAQREEDRPFLGDTWAFDHLARLGTGADPLVGEGLTVTALGEDVLAGRARWTGRVQGFWLGGARSEDWAYDPELRRPVRVAR